MTYSRLDRKKNPPNIITKDSGGIFDLFDNEIKEIYLITDKEYDYLAEKMSEYEISLFVNEELNFGEKRELLRTFNKYLDNQ